MCYYFSARSFFLIIFFLVNSNFGVTILVEFSGTKIASLHQNLNSVTQNISTEHPQKQYLIDFSSALNFKVPERARTYLIKFIDFCSLLFNGTYLLY